MVFFFLFSFIITSDQPAGTGFSYSNSGGFDSNEKEVGNDMYHFLLDFFANHPQWQKNDFFVVGESYGGHFVPATAHRVWQGNQKKEGAFINLKGLAIGNGLVDPEVQYTKYPEMIWNYTNAKLGHSIVSESTYQTMLAEVPGCIKLIKGCNQQNTFDCDLAYSLCNAAEMSPYSSTGMNPYNIELQCQIPPLCYNFNNLDNYVTQPAVLAALGVNSNSQWSSCNFQVNGKFQGDWMHNYQTDLPDLLNAGIRVLVYSGDLDFVCNWIGGKAWATQMKWPGQAGFDAAPDVAWNNNAGEVRSYHNLSFLRVHNAGHMVPMDQPVVALQMITQFTQNVAFPPKQK